MGLDVDGLVRFSIQVDYGKKWISTNDGSLGIALHGTISMVGNRVFFFFFLDYVCSRGVGLDNTPTSWCQAHIFFDKYLVSSTYEYLFHTNNKPDKNIMSERFRFSKRE